MPGRRINLTAIIIALNEEGFIATCIKAIYEHVQRIIIVTNYDTDYYARELKPDATVDLILNFPDPDRKIIVMINRKVMDEVIQRNWALKSDLSLHESGHRKFLPHFYSLEEIKANYPETDYYWTIDADEIYDPETVPHIIDYVAASGASVVLVRGYNHFKKWNYRTDPKNDQFWAIGFMKPKQLFYARRKLYFPRFMGWISRMNPVLSETLINMYQKRIKLPEEIGFFYHGGYIGDTERMKKKIFTSSHAKEHSQQELDAWFKNVWEKWTPHMKDFYFASQPEIFSGVDIIPTEKLPAIIRNSDWPDGWIDKE